MLYIAISIVVYGLISNGVNWYQVLIHNKMKNIVKYGALEFDGVVYKITEV